MFFGFCYEVCVLDKTVTGTITNALTTVNNNRCSVEPDEIRNNNIASEITLPKHRKASPIDSISITYELFFTEVLIVLCILLTTITLKKQWTKAIEAIYSKIEVNAEGYNIVTTDEIITIKAATYKNKLDVCFL